MITVECKKCGKLFQKTVQRYKESIKNGWNLFCSQPCRYAYQKRSLALFCAQCKKSISKPPGEIRKTKRNTFCSKSCAAIFNNAHKAHHIRRSKLEKYIEQRIKEEFPSLRLICNSSEVVGIELDFYFPTLKLAVELNGVVHYKPIYGEKKLERILKNDRVKSVECKHKGIDLRVFDVSQEVSFNQRSKEKFWGLISEIIELKSGREDLNLRPLPPQGSALPGCATSRVVNSASSRTIDASIRL
jgi:hypothetical protein